MKLQTSSPSRQTSPFSRRPLIEALDSRQMLTATASESLASAMLRALATRPAIVSSIDFNPTDTTPNVSASALSLSTRVASSVRNKVLIPGTGFTSPVNDNFPQIGSSSDKTIARWDVVPYQTFTSTLRVGVAAFHLNGIDRVEFSVNGGAPIAVTRMTLNPDSGVVEYWAMLDASKFSSDGAVQVRAVAYPVEGVPRALESMTLNSNGQHTLPSAVRYVSLSGDDATGDGSAAKPFKSMITAAHSIQLAQGNVDGGTIYLAEGDYTQDGAQWYNSSANSSRWLTIAAAPGANPADVRITGTTSSDSPGFNVRLVHFDNITFTAAPQGGGSIVDDVWYENSKFISTSISTGSFDTVYLTDSSFRDVNVAIYGATLVRDVDIDGIEGDAFTDSLCVINSSVINFAQGSGSHANVYQTLGSLQNVVLYGIRSVSSNVQVFQYNADPVGHAIVNCDIDATNWFSVVLGGRMNNIYYQDNTFHGNFVVWPGWNGSDVVFDTCSFNGATVGETGFPGAVSGVTFR